ncbi:MAG: ABC transporter permease [Synergistaceae bacterium]|jgi:simple sugar transport system permease protein|nr:ABC transporter permease [Synergistaceae bacterium]
MEMLSSIFTYSLLHATLRMSTPVILATMAAVVSRQGGITNIGIEGTMLFGAYFGFVSAYVSGSWIWGLAASVLAGVLASAVIGVVHLKYNTHIFVTGFAVNMLALGLTRFLLQQMFHVSGALLVDRPVTLPILRLSIAEGNPITASLFSSYSLFEPLAPLLVAGVWYGLYRTSAGLRLRSVGLHEPAARTAGIDVRRTKMAAILLSGVFAGMAGAHLSMGYSSMFVENMTNGRGFMALAAANFGGGNPLYACLGCLVFGFSDSVAIRLQSTGFPAQFVLMIPYLVTVVVLTSAMIGHLRRSDAARIARKLADEVRVDGKHADKTW